MKLKITLVSYAYCHNTLLDSDVTKLVEIHICLMRILTYKTCGMRM